MAENSYFDHTAADDKPMLHLWSLGVEEQFYIVWPFVLWFAWRSRLSIPLVVGAGLAVSFLLNVFNIGPHPVATFYTPATRIWELAAGSLLAWHWQQRRSRDMRIERGQAQWMALAGVALLAAAMASITRESPFPGWLALLPVLGTVLLIHAGDRAPLSRVVLSHPVLVWIGLISYPLYLWHWPLLSFARIVLSDTPPLHVRVGAVAAAFLLAWLTYELVEKPLRFGAHRQAKALALVAGLALAGSVGLAVFLEGGVVSRDQAARYAGFDYNLHWQGWTGCGFVRAPDKDGGCKILHADRPVDAVVLGDSHAGHLGSGLRNFFEARGENAAVMLYAGCYPLAPVNVAGHVHFKCPGDLIAHALDYAEENPHVKTVMLSGFPALQIQQYRYYEGKSLSAQQLQENLAAFDAGLDVTLGRLTASGKRVVFFLDNPELLKDPRSCVARWWITHPRCDIDITRAQYASRNAEFLGLIARYREKYPTVAFVSSAEALCDGTTCYGYRDGKLLYSSRDHLSPDGSRLVLGRVAPLLSDALGAHEATATSGTRGSHL